MTPKLINYLASSNPCLFIPTIEDNKALTHVVDSLVELGFINRELSVWKSTTGMLTFPRGKWVSGLNEIATGRPIMGFVDALNKVAQTQQSIGVFYHVRSLLEQPNTIQAIIDAAYQAKQNFSTIIFIGSFLPLPPELLNIVTYVDFPLPTKDEIEALFEELIQAWEENHKLDFPKNKKKRKEILSKAAMSAQGLDMLSAENALALAISITAEPNAKIIQSQKEQHIKKSDVLEFVNTDISLNDVGGFSVLKEWLLRRKEAFSDKAKTYGLPWPKGVLLLGIPGAGKSHAGKAIASFLELPLLRLDISNVFSRYLGDSELRMRQALNIVEAISPCVTGDTLVTLSNGEEKSIVDLFNSFTGSLSVLAMNSNYALVPTNVKAITKRKAPDLFEVSLMHSSIKATGDHLHPVLRDGELEWVKTKELCDSDFIAIPRDIPTAKTASLIDYLPAECRLYFADTCPLPPELNSLSKRYQANCRFVTLNKFEKPIPSYLLEAVTRYSVGRGGTADSTIPKIPQNMDSDLGYLLGLVLSDGTISKSGRTISFGNTSYELHTLFSSFMVKLFGITPSLHEVDVASVKPCALIPKPLNGFKPYWNSRVSNKLLCMLFSELYHNLLSLPRDVLKGVVRGYLDGDGSVSYSNKTPKIILCATRTKVGGFGHNLKHILKSLLLRVGIISSQFSGSNLEICGKDKVLSFITEIGSSHPDKIQKMINIQQVFSSGNHTVSTRSDVIPVGNLLKIARLELKRGASWFRHIANSSSIFYFEHNTHYPDRDKLRSIIKALEIDSLDKGIKFSRSLQKLRRLVDAPIAWSKVKSITPLDSSNTDVYDLVCEENHNFIANNIITHNCILWVDEIDKAMSGMESSGKTDSGVTARVLSTLLTWRQETTHPIFMVCTANDPAMMPSMIYRKGRLDEIWAVDLPTALERGEIFKIHLERRKRDASLFDTVLLANRSKNFTGAEIEAAIEDAMFNAFYDNVEVDTTYVLRSIENTLPQSDSTSEEYLRLKEWMDTRARSVSFTEESNIIKKSTPILRDIKSAKLKGEKNGD